MNEITTITTEAAKTTPVKTRRIWAGGYAHTITAVRLVDCWAYATTEQGDIEIPLGAYESAEAALDACEARFHAYFGGK